MTDLFQDFNSRDAFKVVLILLDNITNCVVCDYPLSNKISNHQFLNKYIPKTKLKELSSNLRSSSQFMHTLMEQEKTDFDKINKLKYKIGCWHDYMTRQHMFYYSRNMAHWNYLGLAFHNLIDSYYHIYARVSNFSTSCFWCEASLNKRWSQILSDIVMEHIPKIYLYLSLAQKEFTLNRAVEVDENFINDSLQNVKFLITQSIRVRG